MAYDEGLAARMRDLIGPDPDLTEKKMFGGLAFLIRGHMGLVPAAKAACWSTSIPDDQPTWWLRPGPPPR
jgi:hypothetical protein